MKYRRELTTDIKLQAHKIFVRNDLFEQVIKSCKATNIEFTMLKEKLGICLYEENYYEEGIIKILDEEPVKEISKVSTKKSTKILSKVLIDEPDNESINESDNESINESDNKNTTSWYDTNKFNKILTTIDNNKFSHKYKISNFKFNDINNLINNINNNTISETDVKMKINELNKIKNAETKGKRLIDSQKTLISLFDDLKTIFNSNNNSNNNESDCNNNSNNNKSDSNNKNENENVNKNKNKDENKDEKDDKQYYLEQINNNFEKVDDTKSFKDQIDVLKEIPDLDDYWYIK